MFPLFGDDPSGKRRNIDLGGDRATAAFSDILNDAKIQRSQRLELKRKQDSAVRIQAWWRGITQLRSVRQDLRRAFEQDVSGIRGLRCLVLLGQDQHALGLWSTTVSGRAQGKCQNKTQASRLHSAPDILHHSEENWCVLLRKTSSMLLRSLATAPQSQYAVSHLNVLTQLLSNTPAAPEYVQYLLRHGFYQLLGQALVQIPVESKASPILPPLVSLLTVPLTHSDLLQVCLRDIVAHILTIPLLPNRLPLQSLTLLSARLPISSFNLISSSISDIVDSSPLSAVEPKIHLLANLVMFTPPRYAKLPATALDTYLQLIAMLMNALPTRALEPPLPKQDPARSWADDDDDSDNESTPQVTVVTSFDMNPAPPPLPQLDKRTLTRLQTYPSVQHLTSLLSAVQHHPSRLSFIAFCFALTTVWPAKRDKVLGTVVAFNGGGLVREVYRLYVRSSPLGRDEQSSAVTNPDYAEAWPPLLFLADLYTQALLTMGDDEFFAPAGSGGAGGARNPLTLDELVVFSRKLLNIAFVLYWREDPSSVQQDGVPGLGAVKWETVRDKLTKCLQAIHAREYVYAFWSQLA
ncbi:hypothetical protein IEO21_04206 [Rhodonia placenta]|uniref:HECT-type E3 ubiquitin transferase n=1 Tax=Rhodonia placenta TaxID=104341 RepID=A0A8H7P4D6_9APHY|nr:hypothetical protein IEO21_04206 [Postia placenta]